MGGSKVFDLVLEIDRAKNERAIWKQRAEEAEAELKRTRVELADTSWCDEEIRRLVAPFWAGVFDDNVSTIDAVEHVCSLAAIGRPAPEGADLETNLRPGDADKLRAFLKQQDARCDAFWPAGPAALAVVCRLLLDEAGGS